MADAGFISVKNWERFQHYRKRNPPWIRLYNDLLDNYEFGMLPDDQKWLLVGLWLLASRFQNVIPADPKWIQKKVNATRPVDLSILLSAGFITMSQDASQMLADCKQSATPETEERQRQSISNTHVQVVFDYWVSKTLRDPAKTKLTAKRSSIIVKRLQTYSPEDLCRAIDGLMRSDYHAAKPEYTDITSCFRNDERVENHIARCDTPVIPLKPRNAPASFDYSNSTTEFKGFTA